MKAFPLDENNRPCGPYQGRYSEITDKIIGVYCQCRGDYYECKVPRDVIRKYGIGNEYMLRKIIQYTGKNVSGMKHKGKSVEFRIRAS